MKWIKKTPSAIISAMSIWKKKKKVFDFWNQCKRLFPFKSSKFKIDSFILSKKYNLLKIQCKAKRKRRDFFLFKYTFEFEQMLWTLNRGSCEYIIASTNYNTFKVFIDSYKWSYKGRSPIITDTYFLNCSKSNNTCFVPTCWTLCYYLF